MMAFFFTYMFLLLVAIHASVGSLLMLVHDIILSNSVKLYASQKSKKYNAHIMGYLDDNATLSAKLALKFKTSVTNS